MVKTDTVPSPKTVSQNPFESIQSAQRSVFFQHLRPKFCSSSLLYSPSQSISSKCGPFLIIWTDSLATSVSQSCQQFYDLYVETSFKCAITHLLLVHIWVPLYTQRSWNKLLPKGKVADKSE